MDALTAAEKGELLGELLAARPELRELAAALAALHISDEDRVGVYVHPGEATDEILDEALQPFLDDLQRRAELGMTAAAVELAVGILCGLYQCRDGSSESLLKYCPDYLVERASDVVDRCVKLGVANLSTTCWISFQSGARSCTARPRVARTAPHGRRSGFGSARKLGDHSDEQRGLDTGGIGYQLSVRGDSVVGFLARK